MARPPSGLGRLSMLHIEEFPSVKVALKRAAELKAASKLYMPRIDDAGTDEPIFSTIETLEALSGP